MQPVRRTWETRDLPILEAYAVLLQNRRAGSPIQVRGEGYIEGFTQEEILEALRVLAQGRYIEVFTAEMNNHTEVMEVTDLTERGRRAVGQWPSEDAGENLLRAIEARIAEAPDDPDVGKLKRVRDELVSIASGTVTGIATAFLRSATGY